MKTCSTDVALARGAVPISPSSLAVPIILAAFCRCLAAEGGVFELPRRQARHDDLVRVAQTLADARKPAEAENLLREALSLMDKSTAARLVLARVLADQGKQGESVDSLREALRLGLRPDDPRLACREFDPFRDSPEWQDILSSGGQPRDAPSSSPVATDLPIIDHLARVTEDNTTWDPARHALLVNFRPDPAGSLSDSPPIIAGHGLLGEQLRTWQREGTAAGLAGVLYDNRDGDHSRLPCEQFPQLNRIEYSEPARRENLHTALQHQFLFNQITFGNSSMAITGGPLWRSQARVACVNPQFAEALARQYASNHLYVYPEHRDHDPDQGDLFPANTPYVIICQGSSGSDQPFLDAVACTLAAFRPDTRSLLAEQGALMPALQMIFRRSNRMVRGDDDYLAGMAHPSCFDAVLLNVDAMIQRAHDMLPGDVPPVVSLKVLEEDQPVVGRDYFETTPREKLFDTPAAVARVARSTQRTRRMVVSAEESRDLNGRPLTWQWRVLRGDPASVRIQPRNADSSVVELAVDWQGPRRIQPANALVSSRVDIGVFASNGVNHSAPGFVTFLFPPNETRKYTNDGRIQSVEYRDPVRGGPYIDPLIITPADWSDTYIYDPNRRLTGWMRTRGSERLRFTAAGRLVTRFDATGKPVEAQPVEYVSEGRAGNPSLLRERVLDERAGAE